MSDPIIILSVLVLLPLIPAFLLFKLLPSRAVVKGPLAGFDVALSGAFAGYFALTIIVATFYAQNLQPKKYKTWVVRGQLQFPDGERPQLCVGQGPPPMSIDANNGFYFQIPVAEGAELPDLVLEANGYPAKSVRLSPQDVPFGTKYKKKINAKEATIQIEEPIVFTKPTAAPAYAPPAASTPVVSGGA
jgi:hypothetical protein